MPYTGPLKGGVDPWHIPAPKPGRHYRWLSVDPRRLHLWTRSYGEIPGYTLVQGPTLASTKALAEELGISPSLVDASNRIVYGFNVLADIPREEHERRCIERVDEQLEKIQAAREQVHAAVAPIPGIRSFEEHPEETADKLKFHKREQGQRPFSGQAGVGASPSLRNRRSN